MDKQFASALYTGMVRHRRFSPKQHAFQYKVMMVYLDTREIDELFSLSPLWSTKRWAPVCFKREDFHISDDTVSGQLPSVDNAVRATVYARTGITLKGPIRMLVNLRYWGVNMNPLSTYYCFDETGTELVAILAEVHNTPWNERHSYVLAGESRKQKQEYQFDKAFHVSPFNPMNMQYRWFSTNPTETLLIHLENWQDDKKIMDATLTLEKEPFSVRSMNNILIRFPWMTVKVIAAIYWQALLLWSKGVSIFNHPKLNNNISIAEEKHQ